MKTFIRIAAIPCVLFILAGLLLQTPASSKSSSMSSHSLTLEMDFQSKAHVQVLAQALTAISNTLFRNVLDCFEYLEALAEAQKVEIKVFKVTTVSRPELKIADPKHFDSNQLQLPNFLAKCCPMFAGEPSQFPHEKTKVYYAGFHLAESVFSWFQPLLVMAETQRKLCQLSSTFSKSLLSL